MNELNSGIAIDVKKLKRTEIIGIMRHVLRTEREDVKHSNEMINKNKTKENIILKGKDLTPKNYLNRVDKIIATERDRHGVSTTIRKDAVYMLNFCITPSGDILKDKEKTIEFLTNSHEYISNKYGEKNVVSSVIHLDETTPHLHMSVIPLDEGRLNARKLTERNELRTLHAEHMRQAQLKFPQFGFAKGNGKTKGMSMEDYKRMKQKEEDLNTKEAAIKKKTIDVNSWIRKIKKKNTEQAQKSAELEQKSTVLDAYAKNLKNQKRKLENERETLQNVQKQQIEKQRKLEEEKKKIENEKNEHLELLQEELQEIKDIKNELNSNRATPEELAELERIRQEKKQKEQEEKELAELKKMWDDFDYDTFIELEQNQGRSL